MKNGSYFVPREKIRRFFNPGAMNAQEGLYATWETDPDVARRVLPPPLDLPDPDHPIAWSYVVNIREPTFAPWYLEGGLALMARYGDMQGVYFLNLQLNGPGACMGLTSGRENAGLPKKICERIVVERTDDYAHAQIVAKGRRIFDLELEILDEDTAGTTGGALRVEPGTRERGSCFLFQYAAERAPQGHMAFPRMTMVNYDSFTDHDSWEPARIVSLTMEPSLDDPWAELAVVRPLTAWYSKNNNGVAGVTPIAEFEGDEADGLISYLFSGRWDRSTICDGHQHYT